jgi:hypothetical protein
MQIYENPLGALLLLFIFISIGLLGLLISGYEEAEEKEIKVAEERFNQQEGLVYPRTIRTSKERISNIKVAKQFSSESLIDSFSYDRHLYKR